MLDDRQIQRAKEAIYDEVRFLAPGEVQRIFEELAAATKVLADKYDAMLQDAICR
jgi:uncharacterized protein YydD (DUF2326 family)